MKKGLFLFCLIVQTVFSKSVSLDNLIDELNKTSYENEIYKVKEKRDLEREEVYKLDSLNGVNVEVENEYSDEDNIYKTKGRVKYADFYIDTEKWKDDDSSYSYGVEKNIKDLIFSKNDSNLEKLKLSKKVELIEFENSLQLQKIELVNLYKDYKEVQLEISIRENALKILSGEKKILQKSYEMGATSKIDLDSLVYSYKNIELEIGNLKKEILNIRKQFFYSFKIDLKDKELEDLNANILNLSRYIEKIGERDTEKVRLEKEIIEKNVKYLDYNNKMPELYLGVERAEKTDENRVYLKVSKDIFYKDLELMDEKSSLTEKEIKLSQKTLDVKSERLRYERDLYSLIKDLEVTSNDRALEESKYNIKKLENQLGKIRYLDVMESFNDYLELKIKEEKSRNNLNAFAYELKIRGEIK
ncbi:TolC family protein [Cetobacterium sp. 8H]|uniref:TolC family protein n=1 Tax=Cetobacterium sp. 8H TaxID=2759681 RepID=UPI00163C2960|nr:TolC family protein [Cetobacterium sp. 8H]MBC2851549.1 TolC family protein [Cetobacterium sp. 8H]